MIYGRILCCDAGWWLQATVPSEPHSPEGELTVDHVTVRDPVSTHSCSADRFSIPSTEPPRSSDFEPGSMAGVLPTCRPMKVRVKGTGLSCGVWSVTHIKRIST
jgi:hypothetical protein